MSHKGGPTTPSSTPTTPSVDLNLGSSGSDPCEGLCVEGNIDTEVTFQGDTMTVKLKKVGSSKWIQVAGLPTPTNGVVFLDTRVDLGGIDRRTMLEGDVTTRTTMATTGQPDSSPPPPR